MHGERADDFDKEWRDFRSMLFAMHPQEAKAILDALDASEESNRMVAGQDGYLEFAPDLGEDEMEDYEAFSVEEVDEAIGLLRRFGVAVSD